MSFSNFQHAPQLKDMFNFKGLFESHKKRKEKREQRRKAQADADTPSTTRESLPELSAAELPPSDTQDILEDKAPPLPPNGHSYTLRNARSSVQESRNTRNPAGSDEVICEVLKDFPLLDLAVLQVEVEDGDVPYFNAAGSFHEDDSLAVIGFGLEDHAMARIPNLTVGRVSTLVKTALELPSGKFVGGEDATYQLFTANVNKGDSGGPVLDINSYELVGVFTALRKNFNDDQGQAVFTVLTRESIAWEYVNSAIEQYRVGKRGLM
ncbi:hypothetical protein PHYPSEUDO_013799 [Phytophthora pseudosyringae]|uniref:Serine protease n=1 Tax=Phytophthora pseudosyringae TaxID=221518 RepID=A0A8T1V5T4_9STRA|nr:hypothetical protein PHYPSEUDO_013799 [Phytophthora pseudosyringae]